MKPGFFTKIISLLLLPLLLLQQKVIAQIAVSDNASATQLAAYLTGAGVIVLNPILNGTCPGTAVGKFSYNGTPATIGIDSGVVLTCGRVVNINSAIATQTGINSAYATFASNPFPGPGQDPGDPLLTTLAGIATHDACVLEFDFVPAGDSIKFDYVFASEEYNGPHGNFNCSINDVFGFFISGPAIVGQQNIALVPGTTNVPVGVSTVNDGVGGCSQYTQYYNSNAGSTSFVYSGYTDVFSARSAVSPCDTYHLKIAIADASDDVYDSGVFLKAGSLTSTALYVHTEGGGGLEFPFTNTVRGCPPGIVRISRVGGNLSQPATIPLTYEGTAVAGVDYSPLPATVTMAPGDTVITLNVNGLPVSPAAGPKSLIINIYSPYTCSNAQPIVLASDTIMIYDSIYVKILNPDTAICIGNHVDIFAQADTMLRYAWTPAATINNPTALNVTATPVTPTNYTISVSLPAGGTACPAATASVFIDVKVTPQINLGPDQITCGNAVQLNAATTPLNPDETFQWQPTTGLSNPTIRNPISTPTASITYTVTVNPGAVGCDGHDSIKIRLLPDHITVLNNDTIVCAGTIIPLRADGDTAFSYNWAPEINVANPLASNTTLNAQTSGYYTLTASFPGCVPMPDSFYVEVQPVPNVSIGPDKVICTYDTIKLYGSVTPANYANYTFDWTPGFGLTDSTVKDPVFSGDNSVPELTLKVTTPIGCTGSDTMIVTVFQGDFLEVTPRDTGTCPPASIQLTAAGAETYSWSPAYGLNDDHIANPIATPVTSTDYTLLGSKNYSGHVCYDTQMVAVHVYPNASIYLPDSVQIWPGESYQIAPEGNCSYFQWFPPSGLSDANISNPVAQPAVRTRYFVTATTEHGCEIKDSIDILVNTETALDAPNAFNPSSGDFKIVKRGIATLQYFRIYNRWGNKVFETSNIDKGWDGTYNGQAQPMGVYIYTIDATTSTNVPFKKNGNLTLIR
jgi:gliding motility-associated-like protein